MTCDHITAKQASFRGVKFHYDSGGVSGGRRGVTHEYPFRNTPYDEDLGRSARRFSVSGYLSGGDLRSKAKELEAAFELDGHGIYYDAFLNRQRIVRCETYSISTSRYDLGIIEFSASFVEKGREPAPSLFRDTLAKINSYVSQFNAALIGAYGEILGAVQDVETVVANFKSSVGIFGDVYRLNFQSGGEQSLVDLGDENPMDALEGIDAAFVGIVDALDGDKLQNFLFRMASISVDKGLNDIAFAGVALSNLATYIASRQFDNRVDAIDSVQSFVVTANSYAELASTNGLNDLAAKAYALSSLLGGRLNSGFSDIPPLLEYRKRAPAIVAAYDIYGDINRASDLIEINGYYSGAMMDAGFRYAATSTN